MGAATALRPLTGMRLLWFRCYTDVDNRKTFLNGTQSAFVSHNPTTDNSARQIGVETKAALAPYITKWLDEEGLTEDYLKSKIRDLCQAQEVKFVKVKGKVKESDKHNIVATSDEETVIAVSTEAHGTQQQATKLGTQVRGMLKDDDDGRKEVHINLINYGKDPIKVEVAGDSMFD